MLDTLRLLVNCKRTRSLSAVIKAHLWLMYEALVVLTKQIRIFCKLHSIT